MKYNYNSLARTYVRGFYKFIVEYTNIWDREEAYILFRYSLKKVYGMEASEINEAVLQYGDQCINYLKDLPDTPKNINKISFEERVHLFDYCETYLMILFLKREREVVES